MFGNKYMADELAKNFQKKLGEFKVKQGVNDAAIKKEASDISGKDLKAEDFLVDMHPEASASDTHSHALDSKIQQLSEARDKSKVCKKCNTKGCNGKKCASANDAKSQCSMCGYSLDNHAEDCMAKDATHKKESSFAKSKSLPKKSEFVNKKAEYVLYELGKVASDLRNGGNRFAADMVEATAIDIKNEEVKKVSEKLHVINELRKMASQSYQEGDGFTADVIQATIENIKNS